MQALGQLGYADSVTPSVIVNAGLRYRHLDVGASVTGVGEQLFRVRGFKLAESGAFDAVAIRAQAQDAVIDENARKRLFPQGQAAPRP